ncbi:SDR family oxidoreductase [Streptomyces sp. BBFR2]|uniref:SDR family oxidoreductase n=1 Tax=Streptomyces sp. BBFR2 TaxID=3372854 RepID=UPI0037D9EBF6
MATFLVTGGTGTLGRAVVGRLLDGGHDVRSLSRRLPAAPPVPGPRHHAVDLRDGTGLAEAVAGVETVVHCASTPSGGDEEAAGHLVAAARAAGVRHLVHISIVGVGSIPLGYYKAKRSVERIVEQSGTGWTILRTTQFHDLVLRVVKAGAHSPLLPYPSGVRVQPIEVREVAARMAELALGEPAGRVPDMGGPQVLTAREAVRLTLRYGGRRRLPVPLWLPGRTMAGFRAGENLAPGHAVGERTYEQFLAERAGWRV